MSTKPLTPKGGGVPRTSGPSLHMVALQQYIELNCPITPAQHAHIRELIENFGRDQYKRGFMEAPTYDYR